MSSLALSSPPAAAEQTDRRRARRYTVQCSAMVTTVDGVPLSGEITNLSATGLRAYSPMVLAKGTRVIVRFNERMRRRAFIAWQIGPEIGCRLQRALTERELAQVIAAVPSLAEEQAVA